jgi:hypothetical protein
MNIHYYVYGPVVSPISIRKVALAVEDIVILHYRGGLFRIGLSTRGGSILLLPFP